MAEAYLNKSDARMRLDDTICVFEGEPVYVRVSDMSNDDTSVRIRYFGGDKRRPRTVDYTDPAFRFNPIKLGYVNMGEKQTADAVYVSRIPSRRQKQGLDMGSLKTSTGRGLPFLFPGVELHRTLTNNYPTPRDAMKILSYGAQGVAVSREFAFKKLDLGVYGLFFKENLTGTYNLKQKIFQPIEGPSTSVFFRIAEAQGLGFLFS